MIKENEELQALITYIKDKIKLDKETLSRSGMKTSGHVRCLMLIDEAIKDFEKYEKDKGS